jgi:DNA-binding response OmpR family regulator
MQDGIMKNKRILVVEDEPDISELIRFNLEKTGFSAEGARDGEEALNKALTKKFHLIILDLMLPGMYGYEVCKKIKSAPALASIPIIMLTARSEEIDKVLGLELGADDYITKPFSPRELVARVKAVLRRYAAQIKEISAEERKAPLIKGDLEIDLEKFIVKKRGRPIDLSTLEFKLLAYLAQKPGKVFSRDTLLDAVWQAGYIDPRTVDVHIRRLREKIEDDPADPEYIGTRRGLGYFFIEKENK